MKTELLAKSPLLALPLFALFFFLLVFIVVLVDTMRRKTFDAAAALPFEADDEVPQKPRIEAETAEKETGR